MQGKTWIAYKRHRKSNNRKDLRHISVKHAEEDGKVWIYASDGSGICSDSGHYELNELTFFIETFQEILALRGK